MANQLFEQLEDRPKTTAAENRLEPASSTELARIPFSQASKCVMRRRYIQDSAAPAGAPKRPPPSLGITQLGCRRYPRRSTPSRGISHIRFSLKPERRPLLSASRTALLLTPNFLAT